MIVGDPQVFAIESSITQAYEQPSLLALGFFIIHIGGKNYGVRLPDATMLACSYDAVERRVVQRGKHSVEFGTEEKATDIADATLAAMYDQDRQEECFFGISASDMVTALFSSEVIWAPDGDEAFDDGGHVLQFDQGNKVRLIAFKNINYAVEYLAEIIISADKFYQILSEWLRRFKNEQIVALSNQVKLSDKT